MNSTHIQKLTADFRRRVVIYCDGLIAGSEQAGPLLRFCVAELTVALQHHLASTHLLQRA